MARKGKYFISADYSQIEARMSAALAGERTLIEGFLAGADYYRLIYGNMFGTPLDKITKTERQLGKIIVLGQSYNQSHYGLARKIKRSEDEAKELMNRYWASMPATRLAKDEALYFVQQHGHIFTYFGRKRYFPDILSQDNKLRGKQERSIWSTYVSGSSADIMKIAMIRCDIALRNRKVDLLLTVHDELDFEVDESEPVLEIAEIIRQAFEFKIVGLPKDCKDLYPDGYFVPADVTLGFSWGVQFDLEDKVKGDKTVQGFRSYCREHGKGLDFSPLPANFQPNFIDEDGIDLIKPSKAAAEGLELLRRTTDSNSPLEGMTMLSGDFQYPCCVITVDNLDSAQLTLVKIVAGKFPGPTRLYLVLKGQRIDTNLSINLSTQVFEFMKKGFERGTVEPYDAAGNVAHVGVRFGS